MERKDVRLGWIPDKPDHRDKVYRPTIEPVNLPASVDLSTVHNVPVVDQGQLGSCTGNGIASALGYLQLIEGESLDYPSRLFIYYNERVIEGSVNDDAGAEIRDGIKTVVSQGYAPETEWPYDISKFTVKPPANVYADAQKDLVTLYQKVNIDTNSMMSALASGYPIIVGFTVYDSFFNGANGDIPMPNLNTESVQGGHAVIVVGYDQTTKKFKFQNSWGTSWGNNGFGTLPFAYLGNASLGSDYWIVTGDQSQGPPVPTPTPDPTPTPAPAPWIPNWPLLIVGVTILGLTVAFLIFNAFNRQNFKTEFQIPGHTVITCYRMVTKGVKQ